MSYGARPQETEGPRLRRRTRGTSSEPASPLLEQPSRSKTCWASDGGGAARCTTKLGLMAGAQLRPVRPMPHPSPPLASGPAAASQHRDADRRGLQLTRCGALIAHYLALSCGRRALPCPALPVACFVAAFTRPGPHYLISATFRCYYIARRPACPLCCKCFARTPIAMSTSHHLASRGAGGD